MRQDAAQHWLTKCLAGWRLKLYTIGTEVLNAGKCPKTAARAMLIFAEACILLDAICATLPLVLKTRPVPRQSPQSSTFDILGPERAVDGRDDAWYRGYSCSHTELEQSPWWEVDLGDFFRIAKVRITDRNEDLGDRVNPFNISVDGVVCSSNTHIRPG